MYETEPWFGTSFWKPAPITISQSSGRANGRDQAPTLALEARQLADDDGVDRADHVGAASRARPVRSTNTSSRLGWVTPSSTPSFVSGKSIGRSSSAESTKSESPCGASCGSTPVSSRTRGARSSGPVGLQVDPVAPEPALELGRLARGDDAAVIDDRDAVARVGLFEIVRRQEERRPVLGAELLEESPDPAALARVEAEGRLVEEEDRRAVEDPAREVERAPHAARERPDAHLAPVLEPEQVERLVDPDLALLAGQAVEAGAEAQVLVGGQVEVEGGLLEDDADLPANPERIGLDVEPRDLDASPGGLEQRRQHADRRRLAGPVRAQEAEELAGADVEVDRVDRAHPTVVAPEPSYCDS